MIVTKVAHTGNNGEQRPALLTMSYRHSCRETRPFTTVGQTFSSPLAIPAVTFASERISEKIATLAKKSNIATKNNWHCCLAFHWLSHSCFALHLHCTSPARCLQGFKSLAQPLCHCTQANCHSLNTSSPGTQLKCADFCTQWAFACMCMQEKLSCMRLHVKILHAPTLETSGYLMAF